MPLAMVLQQTDVEAASDLVGKLIDAGVVTIAVFAVVIIAAVAGVLAFFAYRSTSSMSRAVETSQKSIAAMSDVTTEMREQRKDAAKQHQEMLATIQTLTTQQATNTETANRTLTEAISKIGDGLRANTDASAAAKDAALASKAAAETLTNQVNESLATLREVHSELQRGITNWTRVEKVLVDVESVLLAFKTAGQAEPLTPPAEIAPAPASIPTVSLSAVVTAPSSISNGTEETT